MGGYNQKERIGVHKFGLLVAEHSNWVFREQPIADIGVDGTLEQATNQDPNGVLIGCQIKCGNGNFYRRKKDGALTRSISRGHYKVWTEHDLPIILILIDDEGTIYWGLLDKNTIKKAKTKFKVEIPKSQKLSPENINDVFEMVSHSKNLRNLVVEGMEAEDNESTFDNVLSIQISGDAGINIGRAFEQYFVRIKDIINRLNYFGKKGVSENRKIINNQISKMATQNNMLGQIVESNTKILAEGSAISLLSIEKYFSNIEINNLTKEKYSLVQNSISQFYSGTNITLKKINIASKDIDSTTTLLLEQINDFNKEMGKDLESKSYLKYKELKKSKIYLSNVLTLLKEELENEKVRATAILDVLKNITPK